MKDCYKCVWNDNCYIQVAIKSYFRHRKNKTKVNFEGFFCSSYQSIDFDGNNEKKVDTKEQKKNN